MAHPSNQETILWLLRHPEPEASVRGRCYGSLDVALSKHGIRQAHSVSRALAAEPFVAVYSSPRQRCVEAASILCEARSCPLERVDALRELDFGEFEGRTYEEIARLYPDAYRDWMERPTETRFPNGENFADMCARVLDAVRELRVRHAGQTIALVTHGGVVRIIIANALAMDLNHIFRIGQRYGAVNTIRYFGATPLVEMVNAMWHSPAKDAGQTRCTGSSAAAAINGHQGSAPSNVHFVPLVEGHRIPFVTNVATGSRPSHSQCPSGHANRKQHSLHGYSIG